MPRRERRDRFAGTAGAGALAALLLGDLDVMRQARADLVEHPDRLANSGSRWNQPSVSTDLRRSGDQGHESPPERHI